MATGASNADLAILLVDARKGVLTQTRRHCRSSSRCSASATSCWRSTRSISSTSREAVRRRSSSDYRDFAASSASQRWSRSRCRRRYGDNVIDAQRRDALVRRARPCSSIWKRVEVDEDRRRPAVPLAGAMGQPAQPRLPRLCRHDRRAAASRRATRSSSPTRGAVAARQAHRHAWTATSTAPRPATR